MESKQKPATKEKRRNNEKRKEKSRNAARCRRSRETEIFTDLGNALPLPQDQVAQLDKASVMRLAISYLRVRDMLKLVPNINIKKKNRKMKTDGSIFLKSLEGFVVVLSQEGDFIYLSENISEYLGITQMDLMGQSVYEYSHPCDHDEVNDILGSKAQEKTDDPISFFLRMKCTLTNKGRSVNLKSATYKVIHCTGHMLHVTDSKGASDKTNINKCFIAIGQIIPHPSNIETPLPTQTFLTKHSLDMKFTYADEKMLEFLGYKSDDLIGKSVYEYHHAMDTEFISSAYKCLFSKGQCETTRYRFLGKEGGYVWVATQASLIHDKTNKPNSVVCVNYVISGIECKNEIYASFQLQSAVKTKEEELSSSSLLTPPRSTASSPSVICCDSDSQSSLYPEIKVSLSPPLSPPPRDSKPITVTEKLFGGDTSSLPPSPLVQTVSRPESTTNKLFVPRTAEMSKGFLMFSEEERGLTLMKDDGLDDLTHLAPVAGDVCVALDYFGSDNIFINNDQLIHNFSPLLTDEPSDPFMHSCDTSPQLLSPNISKNSESSLHSINSPTESALGDDEIYMSMDEEFMYKAPYIPMSMSDDLPLYHMSDDFAWNNSNTFGSDKETSICKKEESTSTLAELLQSGITKGAVKSVDTGGGTTVPPDDYYDNIKSTWTGIQKKPPTQKPTTQSRTTPPTNKQSTNKRSSNTRYNNPNKRTKADPLRATSDTNRHTKDQTKMTTQLIEQLISVQNRSRTNDSSRSSDSWLLDSDSTSRNAACVVSQPSDSVLMNLLDDEQQVTCPRKKEPPLPSEDTCGLPPLLYPQRDEDSGFRSAQQQQESTARENTIRKNSFSLLEQEMTSIPSFLDLTEQDCEVNAPVNSQLLQGEELINALENQCVESM